MSQYADCGASCARGSGAVRASTWRSLGVGALICAEARSPRRQQARAGTARVARWRVYRTTCVTVITDRLSRVILCDHSICLQFRFQHSPRDADANVAVACTRQPSACIPDMVITERTQTLRRPAPVATPALQTPVVGLYTPHEARGRAVRPPMPATLHRPTYTPRNRHVGTRERKSWRFCTQVIARRACQRVTTGCV